MRYIELKQITTRKAEVQPVSYATQLEHIVGEAYEGPGGRTGFDRETNKRALRVLRRLEALPEGARMLALEDADHNFLLSRVNSFVWPFADQAFEDFCLAVEEAPSEEPAPVAATAAS